MRHVSRTHRVALDWLFDRINLDPKIQIKYIDTKTPNSLTFWPKEISRVTNGIIFCACLTLAISVLQFALLQWQNDFNKIQEKNQSQQNQNLWWISLRGCHRSCRLELHWARGREITENKILGNPLLQMIDQGNLINSLRQIIRNWIMTVLGLLKSGKVRLRHTIDQGNLIKLLGVWHNKFCPHHGDALLDGNAQSVRYGEILRDRSGQLDNINSQEVADSTNFVMGSDAAEFANKVNWSQCEKDRKECPTLQAQERNIQ